MGWPPKRYLARYPRPTEMATEPRRWGPRSRFAGAQLPDSNASEVHLVSVILEHDVPAPSLGEPRDRPVLAGRQRRVHRRRAEVALHDLLAIQPLLDVAPHEDDPGLVPFANGAQALALIRREQVV